jgi:hypothetical protein
MRGSSHRDCRLMFGRWRISLGVGARYGPCVGALFGEVVGSCLGYGEGPVVCARDGPGVGAQAMVWAWPRSGR